MEALARAVVRWTGKETLRYELGALAADVLCYCDPARNLCTVLLSDMGNRNGQIVRLSAQELGEVERALRNELGTKRFFGIPIGTREVQIEREGHVS